ncbi:molybdopterin molybdenumtransferase MoeA, partial [Psychrobacter sp. Rd 27.2]
ALWQLSGARVSEQPMQIHIKAKLANDIKKSVGRKDFQRGVLRQNAAGEYEVECFARQQSHRIKQLSLANCFVVLDKDSGDVAAGSEVIVQPFPWLHQTNR